jgi:hypothetical protein
MRDSDPSIVRGPETEAGRECYYCWDGEVNLFRPDSTSKRVINASGHNRRAIAYIVYENANQRRGLLPKSSSTLASCWIAATNQLLPSRKLLAARVSRSFRFADSKKLMPIQPERLVTLFRPWPPARPPTEAVSVFGMEVAGAVTRWLELADAAVANSDVAKPRRRRFRRHFRRERMLLRKRRRSS